MGFKEDLANWLKNYGGGEGAEGTEEGDEKDGDKGKGKEATVSYTKEEMDAEIKRQVDEAIAKEEAEQPKTYTQEEVDAAVQAQLAKRSKAAPPSSTATKTNEHPSDVIMNKSDEEINKMWDSGEIDKMLANVEVS